MSTDDIVERLRRPYYDLIDPHADRGMRHANRIPVLIRERHEAADEIVRLRAENSRLTAVLHKYVPNWRTY